MNIDYKQFCYNRFDIVIRYFLLTKSQFNVFKASNILDQKEYLSLKSAINKVNPRLINKGIFNQKRWCYVEKSILNNPNWLKAYPYSLNLKTNFGYDVKRLLLSIKYKRSLYWKNINIRGEKNGYSKKEFIKYLPNHFLEELKIAEKLLIKDLESLSYFTDNQRVSTLKIIINKIKFKIFHNSKYFIIKIYNFRKNNINKDYLSYFYKEIASYLYNFTESLDLDFLFNHTLEAGKTCVKSRFLLDQKYIIPTTRYAKVLQQQLKLTLENLSKSDSVIINNLQGAFVEGSVGYGYAVPIRKIIEGEKVPKHTSNLFQHFYTWVFCNPHILKFLSNSRLFNNSFSSDIDLRFILLDISSIDKLKFTKLIKKSIISKLGFSPQIEIKFIELKDLELKDFLRGKCIYKNNFFLDTVKKLISSLDLKQLEDNSKNILNKFISNLMKQKHYTDFQDIDTIKTANKIGDYLPVNIDDFIVKNPSRLILKSEWYVENQTFFNHIETNNFDKLIIEDATNVLNDKKGLDKDKREFVIIKIDGLIINDKMVKASNVVLKVRGISPDKKSIDVHLDLIKEYYSYTNLHQKLSKYRYMPSIGPFVLKFNETCFDINLEKDKSCSGFFMENISEKEMNSFTMRIYEPSSLIKFSGTLRDLWLRLNEHNINLSYLDLFHKLFKLSFILFIKGIQITACDLCIVFNEEKGLNKIILFDFERLSFARLTGENHILLPTLIDIKMALPKKSKIRNTIMSELYSSLDQNMFLKLNDILLYLNINRKWLWLKNSIYKLLYYRIRPVK